MVIYSFVSTFGRDFVRKCSTQTVLKDTTLNTRTFFFKSIVNIHTNLSQQNKLPSALFDVY